MSPRRRLPSVDDPVCFSYLSSQEGPQGCKAARLASTTIDAPAEIRKVEWLAFVVLLKDQVSNLLVALRLERVAHRRRKEHTCTECHGHTQNDAVNHVFLPHVRISESEKREFFVERSGRNKFFAKSRQVAVRKKNCEMQNCVSTTSTCPAAFSWPPACPIAPKIHLDFS